MKSRDYFLVGCKLLGVYSLLLSFPHIFNALSPFFMQTKFKTELFTVMFPVYLSLSLVPIFYIFFGIYLLWGGRALCDFAFPDESHDHDFSYQDLFPLAFKVFGLYLIIMHLPDFIRSIGTFVANKNAPSIYRFTRDSLIDYGAMLSSSVGVLLGFYLLRSGAIFTRIAMKDRT